MPTVHRNALAFDSDPYSVTNFVDRMHRECADLQWLRELVVNSIEAIAATGQGGKILVHSIEQDMGPGFEKSRKLAVTDTGEGIAPDQLYSSFQVAMTSRGRGNFGIGAKIAALPLNPGGMIYRSKVDGEEAAELIWQRTGLHGWYEAREWLDETGESQFVTAPSCDEDEDSYARILEAGHGTQVVLCGQDAEDDTCRSLSPSTGKASGNLHWAIRQLNFKFWKIPSNIEIRVENAKLDGAVSGPANYIVHGGEHGMKSFAEAQGIVDLEESPYRVRWFLLKEGIGKRSNQHNGWGEGRIVATLYREKTGVAEVYAMRRTRRGGALMNDFGIYSGADRVVLLIDPTRPDLMQPTTARNDLRVGDEGNVTSAYQEIGAEFAALMGEKAPVLAAYVKQQLEGLKSTSDEDALKEVMAKVAKLFEINDYRRLAKGKVRTQEGELEGQPAQKKRATPAPDPSSDSDLEPDSEPEDPLRVRPARPRPRPRPRQRLHADSSSDNTGKAVPPEIIPKRFTWVPLGQDQVTDYTTHTQKAVQVNMDGEMYNRLLALYKTRPGFAAYSQVVEDAVRRKCESTLQLSIFTLEHEFNTRRARLGLDFEGFFERHGAGRVCLDAMASKEVENALVREIRNLISKAKNKEAADARAMEASLASG